MIVLRGGNEVKVCHPLAKIGNEGHGLDSVIAFNGIVMLLIDNLLQLICLKECQKKLHYQNLTYEMRNGEIKI